MRNKMSKYDRFDLEAEIQSVWSTEVDLDTILYRLMDSSDGPCTEDEIANMLIGLKEIHKSRCLKLWDMFETMVKEKCFKEIINGTEENNSETETTQD